jgi:hypothetical protein
MSPKSHSLAYRELLNGIQELYSYTNVTDLDPTFLFSKFQQVQQIFDKKILVLNEDGVEHSNLSRWRSLQTEIHRSLRLLGTDLMLLRSARQDKTLTTRSVTVRQRLEQLITYCQHLSG